MSPQTKSAFRIGKTQLDLLEELTNANGVSGNEIEVIRILHSRMDLKSKEGLTFND